MDGQKITITLAGKKYGMLAANPEMESFMRRASTEVNKMLESLEVTYQGAHIEDKLATVAFRQAIARLYAEQQVESLEAEISSVSCSMQDYLKEARNK